MSFTFSSQLNIINLKTLCHNEIDDITRRDIAQVLMQKFYNLGHPIDAPVRGINNYWWH